MRCVKAKWKQAAQWLGEGVGRWAASCSRDKFFYCNHPIFYSLGVWSWILCIPKICLYMSILVTFIYVVYKCCDCCPWIPLPPSGFCVWWISGCVMSLELLDAVVTCVRSLLWKPQLLSLLCHCRPFSNSCCWISTEQSLHGLFHPFSWTKAEQALRRIEQSPQESGMHWDFIKHGDRF